MSDLKIIKQKLLDENKIEKILEEMGCEHIHYSAGRIEAQLPLKFQSNNRRSVQVKLNESLTSSVRSRGDFNGGDIYGLVSYIHHDKRGSDIDDDLFEAKKFICETLGWEEYLNGDFKPRKDYVAPLRALMGDRRNNREIVPNDVLPEEVMNDYLPYPSHDWIEEGISYDIQKLYDVRFDLESHRIVFPIRNRFGKIVGVKGRLISKEDERFEPKYIYLHKCNISQEWFNFFYALPYILAEKKVIIVESEKSCMKFASLDIWNTIAIGSSDISTVQADIVKMIGIDIEIYLAYDKDKSAKDVRMQAEKFKGRTIYGVIDIDNQLEEKDAPIDKGLDVWMDLYTNYAYEIEVE